MQYGWPGCCPWFWYQWSRLPVPRWYNEGYAELFSGTDIERGRFETGKMDDGRLAVVGNFGLLSLEQLFDPFNEEASDIFMARY